MCGLVGVAGNLEFKDENLMKRLLVLDYFRGTDSTGLAAVRASREVHIAKIASHPMNLFDTKRFSAALDGVKSMAFIGHNRAATVGKVNDNSAHPYEFGDVVGAHNGTLFQHNWKALEKELGFETLTDSEAIISCIDEFGIEDTIEMLIEGNTSQHGAWALTFYDRDKDSINLIRNQHRPLWMAFNDKGNKVMWASEWAFIEAAVRMTSGWDLWIDDKGHGFFELPVDTLYEFPIEELTLGLDLKNLKKYAVKKLKGKEVPKTTYNHNTYSGGAPFYNKGVQASSMTQGGTTTSRGGNNDKVVELFGSQERPFGNAISVEKFEGFAANGCSYCCSTITTETEGVFLYEEDEVILCPSCAPKQRPGLTIYTKGEAITNAAAKK